MKPSRGELFEPGQDWKVAAIKLGPLCGGFIFMNKEEILMSKALLLAKKAFAMGEIPVGALVVDKDGNIIGEGYNQREKNLDISSHAEIEAIKMAEKKKGSWQLSDCSLFVTLEPCLMCAGAILQSKIHSLYFGAKDEKMGAVVSNLHVFDDLSSSSRPLVYGGILEKECADIMLSFFQEARKKSNK